MQPGVTLRDLVHAIPYYAIQQGLLTVEKKVRETKATSHELSRPTPHGATIFNSCLGYPDCDSSPYNLIFSGLLTGEDL